MLKLIPLNEFNRDWKRDFESVDDYFSYVKEKGYKVLNWEIELANKSLAEGKRVLSDTSLGQLVNPSIEKQMTEYTSF